MEDKEFRDEEFFKATLSQYVSNRCVQVAIRTDVVGVRESKDPSKVTLCFSVDEWRAFVAGVKAGQFDV